MVMHVCTLLVPKLCTTYPSTCHQMCFWRAWYVFRKGLHLICHFSILVLEDFEWGDICGGSVCWSLPAYISPQALTFFPFLFSVAKGSQEQNK